MAKPLLFVDIETICSQDPAVLAEIEAKYPLPVLDLDGIKADGRLKDEEKIAADIAAKREKAVADHEATLVKRLADIDEAYRKTALNGATGHLASIAYAFDENIVDAFQNHACDVQDDEFDEEGDMLETDVPPGQTIFDLDSSQYRLDCVKASEHSLLTRFFRTLELSLELFARGAAQAAWDAAKPHQLENGRWQINSTDDGAYVQMVADKTEWLVKTAKQLWQTPILVAHFADFDIRFVWQRDIALGVPVPAWWPVHASKYDDSKIRDTMTMWAGHGNRVGLDALCRALGVAGKSGMDGSMVWDAVREGRIEEVVEYNRGDVRRLRSVHRRMRGLPVLEGDVRAPGPITAEEMDAAWKQKQADMAVLAGLQRDQGGSRLPPHYVSPDAFVFDEATGSVRVVPTHADLTVTEKTDDGWTAEGVVVVDAPAGEGAR